MPEPLLEVRDVHMDFTITDSAVRRARRIPAEVLSAVDGVDLEIMRGEALGLVGESGCGKSTLGRCIVGLHAPTAGEIRYAGEPLHAKRARSERRRVQMVFQDPYSSLNPRMTVRQTLSELLRVHKMVPRSGIDARCRELLDLVGLPPRALDSHPRNFSGGQRQRVSIARALALQPELLVADEPVSAIRPRYMTATRSQTCRTTAMLWAMKSIVSPSFSRSSSSRLSTVACTDTSSADTGSSATSSSGSRASARAIDTRCRWPPENCRGCASSDRGPRPTRSTSSRQRSSTRFRGTMACTRSSSLSVWRTVIRGLSDE